MKAVHWLPIAGLMMACGGQGAQSDDAAIDYDTVGTLLTVEQLPPMPAFPEARRGRLVTVTAGDYDLSGVWDIDAGLCAEIGVLEIYAGPSGLRTAILLHLTEGDSLGTYPVVAAALDFPDAPAALIAVQVFENPEAFGFQAFSGELELSDFGARVSGRFNVTLREIGMDLFTHFVGVFEEIMVDPLSPDYCRVLRDSTVAPDSGSVADSTVGEGQ
jgi:hypothetical protein